MHSTRRLDIVSESDWAEGVNEVVARYGKVNVLVNCAAAAHYAKVEETTVEDWDHVMAVNGKGTFLGTREVIPHMRRAGGGSIINISSGAGLVGQAWSAAYNASKAAVHLLAKCTAIQYARDGIRCNSVHPGAIDTQMLHAGTTQIGDSEAADRPMGRMGTPGRDRLRCPLPSLRRIELHDRHRTHHRRRQAVRPVAIG